MKLERDFQRKDRTVHHVLVAVGNYPPGHGGGGLRAHRTYLHTLKRLPLKVTAFTVSGRGYPRGVQEFEGIEVVRLREGGGFVGHALEIWQHLIKSSTPRVDVVHALGLSHVATAACALGQLMRIPVVREMTIDGPLPVARGLHSRIARKGFTGAVLLVALNRRIERTFIDAGIEQQRIWCRPNPVDTQAFSPADDNTQAEARRSFGLPQSGNVHLVMGRFQSRKNQLFAVEVLSQLGPDDCLLLVGPAFPGDEGYLEEVRDSVGIRSLQERVVILPEQLIPPTRAFHAADCCWIPSTKEGLSNVMLEALCCGVPVVVNRDLAMEEHVKDGYNGYNVPLDPGDFADAVRRVQTQMTGADLMADRADMARRAYCSVRLNSEFADRLAVIVNSSAKAGVL